MTTPHTPMLPDIVREIVDRDHLAVLTPINPDGGPQSSVIFVTVDQNDLVFSTIKGRRKTINMQRDARVNLLLHRHPGHHAQPAYVTISGVVELTEDPDGAFHQKMYDIHMGGATPPPEPGAERVIVRLNAQRFYEPPTYPATD